MAKFELDGISLRIPGKCLTPELQKALDSGRYESAESGALKRHAQPGDRLLDLGAGAGYVSAQGARIVGGEAVVAVEASTEMLEHLRHNLDANGARGATVLEGAVVADDHSGDSVAFAMRPAFWASSIAGEGVRPDLVHEVPALRLNALLEEYRPSIVTMDVEGAELDLCQQSWPDHVRLVIMEIHSKRYGAAGIQAIFDGLSRSGLTYMPWGSRGEVVVFQRVAGG